MHWSVDAKGRALVLKPIPHATFPLTGTLIPSQAQAIPPEGILEPSAALSPSAKEPRRLFVFVSVWPETVPIDKGGAPSTETKTQPANASAQMLQAVRNGDAATLQKLIDQGVDPKTVKGDYPTLLFEAGSPEVAEILIAHGVDVNARDDDWNALALICSSSLKSRAEIARVLLKHGADPNAQDRSGYTPVVVAQDGATVDVLIEFGAKVNIKLKNGSDVMGLGHSSLDLSYFQALERHGYSFASDAHGSQLLVAACHNPAGQSLEVIKWLLDRGVDPNAKGIWVKNNQVVIYNLPLQTAAIFGNDAAVKLLLSYGAKGDDYMITALHNGYGKIVKLFWESGVRNISELCYAVSQEAPVGDLQKLLDQGMPADPPQDKIITPLGEAARLGNMDAVKLLTAHHADPNGGGVLNPKYAQETRTSPLWLAASEGQNEVVEYLLQHGATPDPTALWQAAENSNPYPEQRSKDHFEKTVRILIDAGALKTVAPKTAGLILTAPIQTRAGGGNAIVLKMLLDAGLSPELLMPYEELREGKKTSVIAYYRDLYAQHKSEIYQPDQLKLLLDMLEAADKGSAPKADVTQNPPSKNAALDKDLLLYAGNAGTDKVGKGDADKIGQLLNQGADPNAKTKDGTSALVWALNFGKDDAAQVLIQHGADASAEDAAGRNAAWTAASIYFCPGALELMIQKGVNVKGLNKKGDTIFSAMTLAPFPAPGKMNFLNDRVWTDAEFQAYQERERRTADLLLAAGVDINGRSGPESQTPLMLAARRGHLEMARELMAHGADVSLKDSNGETAAVLAKMYGHPELLPPLEAKPTSETPSDEQNAAAPAASAETNSIEAPSRRDTGTQSRRLK